MILPKGKILYENLNTSFTNFEKLLSDLRAIQHTGTINIVFWDYEGTLFFEKGNIVNAMEEIDDDIRVAQDAIDGLLKKVTEKDGTISVYELSGDLVQLLANTAKSELMYRELYSDFTDFTRLLEKLSDMHHTGYIEVVNSSGNHRATIFLQAGEPLQSILSLKAETITTKGIHPQISELVQNSGLLFNVYKSGFGSLNGNVVSGKAMYEVLNFWGKAISIAEKRLTPNVFPNVLRKILLEKADKYPFLDPFVDEFQYADGNIFYHGKLTTEFNEGMTEVLAVLLKRFSDIHINNELQRLIDTYRHVLARHALENNIYQLFK